MTVGEDSVTAFKRNGWALHPSEYPTNAEGTIDVEKGKSTGDVSTAGVDVTYDQNVICIRAWSYESGGLPVDQYGVVLQMRTDEFLAHRGSPDSVEYDGLSLDHIYFTSSSRWDYEIEYGRLYSVQVCDRDVLIDRTRVERVSTGLPEPGPSQSPNPDPVLEGIILGENSASVLRRFHASEIPTVPTSGWSGDFKVLTFPSTATHGSITIYYSATIRLISFVGPGRGSATNDPFGIAFGDSSALVQRIRGKPNTITRNGDLVYRQVDGIEWEYMFQDGRLILISVSNLDEE
jgi:hypothetical protein